MWTHLQICGLVIKSSLTLASTMSTTTNTAEAPTIQLAGHIGAFTKLEGGRIRKLVKNEEADFYEGLAARNLEAEILRYIPRFFGLEEHDGKST